MKVSRITSALESMAPPELAADWDNVGLLIGDPDAATGKMLMCIDLTDQVLAEALRIKAKMIMAYHPVIFRAVSRITPAASPVVYAAARHGLAVYCMHTALDAAPGGTNDVLADAIGLGHRQPLEPSVGEAQSKVVVFTPPHDLSAVGDAAFGAGAGRIGDYYDCAFFCHGIGAFCGAEGTHPEIGLAGRHQATEELRLEVVVPNDRLAAVCAAIREAHSYEEPAIDVYPLRDLPPGTGMGRVGRLHRPVTVKTLIARLKKATGVRRVLLAASPPPTPTKRASSAKPGDGQGALVTTAACAAGSAGSMFRSAIAAGATFYVTGEMRHHDALAAAAAGMTAVCLGHSYSERITLARLATRLGEELRGLDIVLSDADRDPFQIV